MQINAANCAPAECPPTKIRVGSPPYLAMFLCTQPTDLATSLQCDIALVPCLPSTSVDPKHDGQALPSRVLRGVDIEDLALVTVLHVGDVRRQPLRRGTIAEEKRENEDGNQPEHDIDSL